MMANIIKHRQGSWPDHPRIPGPYDEPYDEPIALYEKETEGTQELWVS